VAAIDTGYETEQVLTARIDLEKQGYDETRGRIFQRDLVERLQALPGVRVAGLAVTLPLNDSRWEDGIVREGDTARIQTFQNFVSTRYLEAMSIPIVLGRAFSDGDAQSSPVAIVNQTLAHRLWPNESPLGQRIRMGQPMEVIGVAQDIKGRNLLESPGPMLYVPLSQQYQPNAVLHLRTSADPAALAETVRREVAALDRNLPVYGIQPLSEHVTATLTPQRLLAHLIASFGLLSLVLAGIGLYGLLAYTVSQRTPEIGIRRALGAQRGAVLRLVVAQGMTLALVGVGLGLTAAFAVTRLLQGLLFGVSALDPLTFATFALLLIGVALLACYIPARRAANVEPKAALRYE
jgi:putative ABC transport system permease protein